MALKDNWVDLEDVVEGVPDSGSDITVEPINKIARAVIALEAALKELSDAGITVDLSNYYTKAETIQFVDNQGFATRLYVDNETRLINETINSALGDIETLLGGI